MIKRVGRGERVNRPAMRIATLTRLCASQRKGHIDIRMSDVTVNRLNTLALSRTNLSSLLVLFANMAEIPDSAFKILMPGRATAP